MTKNMSVGEELVLTFGVLQCHPDPSPHNAYVRVDKKNKATLSGQK